MRRGELQKGRSKYLRTGIRPKKITNTTNEMPNMTNKIFLSVIMISEQRYYQKFVRSPCYKMKVMAEMFGVIARMRSMQSLKPEGSSDFRWRLSGTKQTKVKRARLDSGVKDCRIYSNVSAGCGTKEEYV